MCQSVDQLANIWLDKVRWVLQLTSRCMLEHYKKKVWDVQQLVWLLAAACVRLSVSSFMHMPRMQVRVLFLCPPWQADHH